MAVIDQRILLVAPSEAIWQYLTDPALVTRWNRGARQVSILTTRPAGIGLRRRVTDQDGKSVVEQVTAWVENIGYEYILIEGPYRSFTGRVRLQPVPEGTVLNWVIEYQLRGPFNGLRNLFGRRRRMAKQMADSLRALRRLIDSSGIQLDRERQQRVAMQADPGLVARQARMSEPTMRQGNSSPAAFGAMPRMSQPPIPLGDDDLPELPPAQPTGYPTSVPTSVPTSAPKSAPTGIPTSIPTQSPRPVTLPAQPTMPPSPRPTPYMPPVKLEPPVVGSRPQPQIVGDRHPANEPLKAPLSPRVEGGNQAAMIPEPPISVDDTKPSIRRAEESTLQNEAAGNAYATVPVDLVAPKPPIPDPEPPTATQNIPSVPPPLAAIPHGLTPDDATRKVEDGQTRHEPPPTQGMPPATQETGAQASINTPDNGRDQDGGHQSIWDIFGVPRPSQQEKEDLGAIIAGLKPKLPEIDPPPTRPPLPPMSILDSAVPKVDQPFTLPEPDLVPPEDTGPEQREIKPIESPSASPRAESKTPVPGADAPDPAAKKEDMGPLPAKPVEPPEYDPTVTREVILPWPELPPAMLSFADEPPTPVVPRSVPPVPASSQPAIAAPIPLIVSVPAQTITRRAPKAVIHVRRSVGPSYGKASVKVRKP